MANIRQITSATAYIETEGDDTRYITSATAYIETEPDDTRRVSAAYAYIEWIQEEIPPEIVLPINLDKRSLATTYDVWLTDQFGRVVAQIDEYVSLKMARKINDVGTLEIEIPNKWPRSIFGVDCRLEVWRKTSKYPSSLEGETCWFIRSVEETLDDDGSEYMIIKAFDANHLFKRRIVPYNAGNSNLNADKVQEADDMMKAIIRENYGADALDTARDISDYLSVAADITLAPQVYKSFSRKVVLDVLQDIAETSYEYGTYLAFDTVYNPDSKTFQFRTYTGQRGTNRTTDSDNSVLIVSPEFGTLTDVSVSDDHTDTYNYVYAGGASIGEIRAVYEVSDDASINLSPFNRIEFFENASDTDDLDELEDAANKSLAMGRVRRKFNGKLELNANILYGVDIKYGDKVTAEYNGDRYDVWIDAYAIEFGSSGDKIEIVLKSE